MDQTELNLPLLKRLLLRGEVVNIRVAHVVSLGEHCVLLAVDDPLTQLEQLVVVVTEHPSIHDMVIVPTAVEPDQLELEKRLKLFGGRVDHPGDLLGTPDLPVHKEQVGKYLDVPEDNIAIRILALLLDNLTELFLVLLTAEMHLLDKLEAVLTLIGGVRGEPNNGRLHDAKVVIHTLLVRIVQDLLDEVDRRTSGWMNLLLEVSNDKIPERVLILHHLNIDHFALLER